MWNYILERNYLFFPLLLINTILGMLLGALAGVALFRWVFVPVVDCILA